VAFDAIFQPLKFRNLTPTTWSKCFVAGTIAPIGPVPTRCLVNAVENPLGCDEESRFPSRDAMVAQIMSVFNPPPFV
jgi:hypothetical protein